MSIILSRGKWVAVLAIVSLLMIFLFPAMHGPYSVVNGPATTLQTARLANRSLIPIVHSAGRNPGSSLFSAFIALPWMFVPEARFPTGIFHDFNTILRC